MEQNICKSRGHSLDRNMMPLGPAIGVNDEPCTHKGTQASDSTWLKVTGHCRVSGLHLPTPQKTPEKTLGIYYEAQIHRFLQACYYLKQGLPVMGCKTPPGSLGKSCSRYHLRSASEGPTDSVHPDSEIVVYDQIWV